MSRHRQQLVRARVVLADLIAVREMDGLPQVTHVWRAGTLVYRVAYPV